jgi:acetyltransferase-like isoleucine patch superfamily enzyme
VTDNFKPLWMAVCALNFIRWRLLGLRTTTSLRGRDFPRIRGRARLIHPRGISIGAYSMVQPGAVLKSVPGRITIGDDCSVGENAILNAAVSITVGNNVMVAPSCHVTDHDHAFDDAATAIQRQGYSAAPVTIGDDCWLGAGATVLAGVTIGSGAVVAASAVVTRDVGAGQIVAGVPARRIGDRGAGRAAA